MNPTSTPFGRTVDQLARDAAAAARAQADLIAQRLSDHITRCEATGMENGRKLDDINRRIWWIVATLVAGQGAGILTLILIIAR